MRIRQFDTAAKNKIIMDVIWSDRNGNTAPYLAVTIHQVMFNGVNCHNWNGDQDAAIKAISPQLHRLKSLHLSSPEGQGENKAREVHSLCERFLSQQANGYTSLDTHKANISDVVIKTESNNNVKHMNKLIKTYCHTSAVNKFEELLNNKEAIKNNCYKRNLESLEAYCIKNVHGFSSGSIVQRGFVVLAKALEELHILLNINTMVMIKDSEIITLEQVQEALNLVDVAPILFGLTLEKVKDCIDLGDDKLFLKEMTELYKINPVKS